MFEENLGEPLFTNIPEGLFIEREKNQKSHTSYSTQKSTLYQISNPKDIYLSMSNQTKQKIHKDLIF